MVGQLSARNQRLYANCKIEEQHEEHHTDKHVRLDQVAEALQALNLRIRQLMLSQLEGQMVMWLKDFLIVIQILNHFIDFIGAQINVKDFGQYKGYL